MAEEDIESLAVPENIGIVKPGSSDKECANGESTGNIGKHRATKKSEKVSPNYLRASTGSCHDFCKYGIKHGFENEEKRPWRKKKNTLTSSGNGKNNCVLTVALPERRKSRSVSLPVNKSSLLQDEASSVAVISPHPPEIIKREITLSLKKSEASDRTPMLKQPSPPALKQPSSYNSVKSGQNTKKDVKPMNSSAKISPPVHSQQVKARLSSSVAGLQPAKARLSSSMQTGGSIKEIIKSSKIKSIHLPHSIQSAGGPNDRNKKSEVKIREVNTKLSTSSQLARPVNDKGKRSDYINTRNNTAAFSSAAKQTVASNRPLISGTTAIKTKKTGSLKVGSLLKGQNRMQKIEIGKTSEENVPEKTLHVVEVETKAKILESTEAEARDISPPLTPPSKFSPPAHEEVDVWGITPYPPQSNLSPILSPKKVMSLSAHEEVDEAKPEAGKLEEKDEEVDVWGITPYPPQSNLSPVLSPKKVMSLSAHEDVDEAKPEAGKWEEKDEDAGRYEVKEEEKEQLHQEDGGGEGEELEEMETDEDSDDVEEYIDDSDEEGEFINGNETFSYDDLGAVEENNYKPLKKGYIVSDTRESVQVKLKFRRGKVLDIQSENKGPRRLRFRRGRIVEENLGSKIEANRRNFSRKDISKGNIESTGDEKIVLRHQDLQGKKDAQGSLLNIVLEETASKLVETRKSKVKALVGAFETVISLHDSKPSAQPVA